MAAIIKQLLRIVLGMCGIFICFVGLFIGYVFSDFNKNIDAEQYDVIVEEIQKAKKQNESMIAMYGLVNEKSLNNSSINKLFPWNWKEDFYESPCLSVVINMYRSSHKERLINNEYIVAHRLEKEFSQEDCLNWLFENANYHYEAKGVEEAAQFYFKKPINELSNDELIGLIILRKAPNSLNPKIHKNRYDKKVNEIKKRLGL